MTSICFACCSTARSVSQLVSRLTSTVRCGDGSALMQGEKGEFGRRVAHEIVFEPKKA